jgi:hypothetical protein
MNRWNVLYFALELNCTFPIIDTLCYHTPYHLQSPVKSLEEWLSFAQEFTSYCLSRYPNVVLKPFRRLISPKYFVRVGFRGVSIYKSGTQMPKMDFDMERCSLFHPKREFQVFDNMYELMTVLFSEIHKAFTA